ncbi:hypothetical protein [uncultured Dokdonia sp.]|uniref:hypothetical protein n=1 Tax=uncultured Dokdonia sp. TaxID=575653 RepID=UPI002634939B|nr:hypothetical protein [uncultured Dokdonia sp.]
MKLLKLSFLFLLPFFLFTSFVDIEVQDQKKPKEYIKLYKKNVGGLAWNWIAENTSEDQAIKFTVQYSSGGAIKDRWTKIFTLEPGDSKHIGRHSDISTSSINAYVKGARFVSH